jgi:hypothetical protein
MLKGSCTKNFEKALGILEVKLNEEKLKRKDSVLSKRKRGEGRQIYDLQ